MPHNCPVNGVHLSVTSELTHFSSKFYASTYVYFYPTPSGISANVGEEFQVQLNTYLGNIGTAGYFDVGLPKPNHNQDSLKYSIKSMGLTKIIVSAKSPVAVVSPKELTRSDLFTSAGSDIPITNSTFVCEFAAEEGGEVIFKINGYLGTLVGTLFHQLNFETNVRASVDCRGSISGCTDPLANNYDDTALVDDGSCTYDTENVLGCTDSTALNYNPVATKDDGSCLYGSDIEELIGYYRGPGTLTVNTCGGDPGQTLTIGPTITFEGGQAFWNSNAKLPLSYSSATGAANGSGVYTDSNGNEVTESADGIFSKDKDGQVGFKGTLDFDHGNCNVTRDVDLKKQ